MPDMQGQWQMSDLSDFAGVKGFDSFPLRLGDLMRGERATLGKSLLDVQRELRIKATYIAAIENCDVTAFQTQGFIAGYVRSYARYLGLDPEATYERFCTESGFGGVHPGVARNDLRKPRSSPGVISLAPEAPNPFGGRFTLLPSGGGLMQRMSLSGISSILILAALILGIGYGAWAVLQDVQRVEFEPLDGRTIAADEPINLSPEERAADTDRRAALDSLYRPKELDVPKMTPRDGPILTLNPDEIGALVADNGGKNARKTAEMMATESPKVTELAPPVVAVVARQPAWIRVSAADGTVLFERVLDSGESFELPRDSGVASLRAGNSSDVYLTIDGKAYGPVGTNSGVAKGVALAAADILGTFEAVKDGKALEDIAEPRVITLAE